MEPKVCLLSPFEARQLVDSGTVPECSEHRHVKTVEAREMTGDSASKIYFRPVARWVGGDGRRIEKLELQHWGPYSGGCRMNGWALMRRPPSFQKQGENVVTQGLKEHRKRLGVSLDELAAALGPGFSRARLSIAERGLIDLSEAEREVVLAAIERIGSLRSEVRSVVERAERVNLAEFCADLRRRVVAV